MVGTDSKATSKTDIADTLGETLNELVEAIQLSHDSAMGPDDIADTLGETLNELVEAIQLSHDSAMGPDEIHYQMLKHLPDTSLETLLNIFNYIWTTGKFPDDWTLATIFPNLGKILRNLIIIDLEL